MMYSTKISLLTVAGLMLLAPLSSASAGPLNDWVYGTPSGYTANYRGYNSGYTANYFPRGFSNDIPGSAAAEPTYYQQAAPGPLVQPPVTYAPQAVAPPVYQQPPAYQQAPVYQQPAPVASGCNTCQSRAYNYRPPAFQTTTMRVPVTVYRPITALDPATGVPVTSYQPCTTYRMQARRVPARGWNFPILSWLFGRRQPVYTQPPVVANYGACRPVAMPACSYPSGSTITAAPIGSSSIAPAQPSWQPATPAQTAPAISPQYTPGQPAPMTYLQGAPPASIYGPQGTPQGGGQTPADRQPVLRVPLDSPPAVESEAETDLNGANGESSYRAPIRRPYFPQPAKPVAGSQPAVIAPQAEPTPRVRLHMVPDPDSPTARPGNVEAPQLIDPRDRTANRGAWGVIPASWPIAEPRSAPSQPRQLPTIAKPAHTNDSEWDESGWEPLRKNW